MSVRISKPQQHLRRTFLKEWRKYRDISQDKVVARASELVNGFSKSSLSRLENGKQAYTQDILEALAEVYSCTPADLIMRDPTKNAPWTLEAGLAPEQRKAVEQIADAVNRLVKPKGTGTDG